MRPRVKRLVGTLVLTAAAGCLLASGVWGPSVVEGQTAVSRLPGTKNPNFNGIWQAMTTANWDILDHAAEAGPGVMVLGAWGVQPGGRGIVEGNQIPYKPEALAKKRANYERRLKFDPQNSHELGDPESKCYMTGVPRAMYQPYPFQMVQTADQILMAFEYASASRMINLKNHREDSDQAGCRSKNPVSHICPPLITGGMRKEKGEGGHVSLFLLTPSSYLLKSISSSSFSACRRDTLPRTPRTSAPTVPCSAPSADTRGN